MTRRMVVHKHYSTQGFHEIHIPYISGGDVPELSENYIVHIGQAKYKAYSCANRRVPTSALTQDLTKTMMPRIPMKKWSKGRQSWYNSSTPGKKSDVVKEMLMRGLKVTDRSRIEIISFRRISDIEKIKGADNMTKKESKVKGKGKGKGNGKGKSSKKKSPKPESEIIEVPDEIEESEKEEITEEIAVETKERVEEFGPERQRVKAKFYSGKKPVSFTFIDNDRTEVSSYKELAIEAAQQLVDFINERKLDSDKLLSLTGPKRPYFSKDTVDMVRAFEIGDGIYTETNLAADRIIVILHRAMALYDISAEELKIETVEKPVRE